MSELLTSAGVSKRFGGVLALSDVAFSIARGEIYGLIGPNGAGKTTLFNLLTGIYAPDEGTFFLEGRRLANLKPHQIAAAGIARTFQNIRLFGSLSALENVMIGRHVRTRAGVLGAVLSSASRDGRCNSSTTSASGSAQTTRRAACRTATSGAWRSRARSPPIPCCSRSMSPPRA
jgi:ABC-type branched-subunit amino acid transport system ATPase component